MLEIKIMVNLGPRVTGSRHKGTLGPDDVLSLHLSAGKRDILGSWPVAEDSLLQHLGEREMQELGRLCLFKQGPDSGPKVVQIRRKEVVWVHKLDTQVKSYGIIWKCFWL